MRVVLPLLLAAATLSLGAQTPADTNRELANVAAFARIYGAVRFFYPSDAAREVDWDRFAVLGVSRVREARSVPALEASLKDLFSPLGPGIDIGSNLSAPPTIGTVVPDLVAWTYKGPWFGTTNGPVSPYSAARSNRPGPPSPASAAPSVVVLAQNVPATELRGRRIRLTARARVTALDRPGWTGLWVRVDRGAQGVGFFDNMSDRPIRQTAWRQYVIQGDVADDATMVVFGVLATESIPAEFDAFELAVSDGETWKQVPLVNAGFEADGSPLISGWGGNITREQFTVGEYAAPEGKRFIRLTAAIAGNKPIAATPPSPNTIAKANAYADFDLGAGLRARMSTALGEAEAKTSLPETLRSNIAAVNAPDGRSDLDVRLADVVVAWNVFRHFYPYWDVAGVDWDARLVPQLEAAYAASTRAEQRNALALLVAEARDGHGSVSPVARRDLLPIEPRVIEGRLVIVASGLQNDAPVGAIITAINGMEAGARLASEMRLVSGTDQWKRWQAARAITSCLPGEPVSVSLELPGGGKRTASLPCSPQTVSEARPAQVAELAAGIRYVDLTRTTSAEVKPLLPLLASAKGVIFDLRGYPTDMGAAVLPYLVTEAESDRWMHVADIAGPFGAITGWQSLGWNLVPVSPRVTSRRVFLTDGRAISYAESVMGYIKDRKLGTILGSATAGTNGNVTRFVVPSGLGITFTGMRVTGHDGKSQHHLIGVLPDIALEPTIAGIRAGRDELLERAIELLRE